MKIDPTASKNIVGLYLFLNLIKNNYLNFFIIAFWLITNNFKNYFELPATKPGVSLSKPVKANFKENGFKTAGDGRLIITDDTDNESDEEKTKKKKKVPFLEMKEDDDYGKVIIKY